MENKLPIIDLSKDWKMIVKEVDDACRNFGFFYISNHGISNEFLHQLKNSARNFFSKPLNKKMEISMDKGGKAWRGYFPVGGELTSGKPDLKEGIYFGRESNEDKVLHGRNLYNDNDMKQVVEAYMDKMGKIGQLLIGAIGEALGKKEEFTKRYTPEPTVLFRIFNYPATEQAKKIFHDDFGRLEDDDIFGVRQHTDYGILTILYPESEGLEVLHPSSGKWMDAPPIDGTFIVNIGDMLELWTDKIYTATLHRVRNVTRSDRLSFPFFFDPIWDAPMTPLLTNKEKKLTERWDNLDLSQQNGTYGEFLVAKVSKVFPLLHQNVCD